MGIHTFSMLRTVRGKSSRSCITLAARRDGDRFKPEVHGLLTLGVLLQQFRFALAADEDRGTGGIDTLRGIFPTLIFCSEQGIDQGAEDEIRVAYEALIERRGAGGAA